MGYFYPYIDFKDENIPLTPTVFQYTTSLFYIITNLNKQYHVLLAGNPLLKIYQYHFLYYLPKYIIQLLFTTKTLFLKSINCYPLLITIHLYIIPLFTNTISIHCYSYLHQHQCFLFSIFFSKITKVYRCDYIPIYLYSFYLQHCYSNPFYCFSVVKTTVLKMNRVNIGKK